MTGYSFPQQNVEAVVGNGRTIARATAGGVAFVFAGAADRLRLHVGGRPAGELPVSTLVRPGAARYAFPGLVAVTHAAAPDADGYLILVESAAGERTEITLEAEAEGIGGEGDVLITPAGIIRSSGSGEATAADGAGRITVTVSPGGSVSFLAGAGEAVERLRARPAAEWVAEWEALYRGRGLRLRTPDPRLDLAVDAMKHHMQLGWAWEPGGSGMMVCDIFRWRDVWSRDFGSGFGPGALVADLYPAVRETLDYEVRRHAAVPPWHYKVSDDASQGGSAEGLGWLMKLVWRLYQHAGDADELRRYTDAFEPWVQAWADRDRGGLVVDSTEWMDHSRYLRLPEGQRTLYSNVLYYAALRRLRHAKAALGDEAAAERYRGLAARTRQALHDAFWNEAGYFNNAVQWGVPDTAVMLADNAIAVTEGVASRNERFRVLETLRERCWRPAGSVTCDLPMKYVAEGNDHNVKVWPWWMAHEAKARFLNYDAEGGLHVVGKIVETLERPTLPGLCEEYLNPDGSQDDVAGHAFITGAGATLDALLYGMVGLKHVGAGERRLRLAPQVPRGWEAWSADAALYEGRIAFEQSPDAYRITTAGTRTEELDLRIPPRESVAAVTLDGREIRPERYEEGASEFLRLPLEPGEAQAVEVHFSPSRTTVGVLARPSALPAPLEGAEPALMDEPRLFADVLQGFIANAVSYFGEMRHVAARDLDGLTKDRLLIVAGNELPYRTKGGDPVPPMIEGFLNEGGSVLLLGPRFAPIEEDTPGQLGEKGGAFWWKVWDAGRWVDYDPRAEATVERPQHDGTVYWGEGPLFQAWEHRVGLFGFETACRGVFDVEGFAVDEEQPVEVVYTDFAARRPWVFHPLAFTERVDPTVTGPRPERYPCAALLHNAETDARIVVVAPTLCSRADLLHRVLRHVVRPAEAPVVLASAEDGG